MAKKNMEKRITHSANETKELGKTLGLRLQGGDIIALYGELGSGKTTFVQGIAQGVGVTRRIVSPTFLILKTYSLEEKKGEIDTFYHADLYRLQTIQDTNTLGLAEIFTMKHVVIIIEWPEKIEEILPKRTKKIRFSYITDDQREIIYE